MIDKQKCWHCIKACNANKCIWVRTCRKYPPGTVIDQEGFITSCPEFEKDKYYHQTVKELTKKYHITDRTYYRIKKLFNPLSGKEMELILEERYGGKYDNKSRN